MKQGSIKLQRLRGVGEVLSRRFIAAGYDSFAKVAAAGEEGLRKIRGVNPRLLKSIVAQAGELADEASRERAKKVGELKQRASSLKVQIQGIAITVRDRFKEEVAGNAGKKVEKEILKVIASLEKVEGKLESKVKKAGKSMAKAEKRLEGLAGVGLKGIGKGLKKARKSLKRVVA